MPQPAGQVPPAIHFITIKSEQHNLTLRGRGEGGQPAKVPAINLSTIKFSIIQAGIPKHSIEVRPIPDSSDPTQDKVHRYLWGRGQGEAFPLHRSQTHPRQLRPNPRSRGKVPGPLGPWALALCLYSLGWV